MNKPLPNEQVPWVRYSDRFNYLLDDPVHLPVDFASTQTSSIPDSESITSLRFNKKIQTQSFDDVLHKQDMEAQLELEQSLIFQDDFWWEKTCINRHCYCDWRTEFFHNLTKVWCAPHQIGYLVHKGQRFDKQEDIESIMTNFFFLEFMLMRIIVVRIILFMIISWLENTFPTSVEMGILHRCLTIFYCNVVESINFQQRSTIAHCRITMISTSVPSKPPMKKRGFRIRGWHQQRLRKHVFYIGGDVRPNVVICAF